MAGIIIEFGSCFIITQNRQIFLLDEKDLQSKLSLLFKKNLYDIAVRIAKNNQYDDEGLAQIFKQYGDHLYNKGDISGAVEQYIKTIGYLEPSYVIRRFLDSRHILCLTDYLQAIHQQGCATADHTTLLLNCFTRLDRTDQLKEFLKNDQNPDVLFDLDVAITVCRNASVEDALQLAKRNFKHDFVVSILTEDMKMFKEALNYISELNYSECEDLLKKYGYILMENCPNETTEIFKRICTANPNTSNPENNNEFSFDESSKSVGQEKYFHLFIKFPDRLVDLLEYLIEKLPKCNEIVYNTLIELYLKQWKTDKSVEDKLIKVLENNDNTYDKNHVLIQCRLYEFWPGILLIYEEQKLYHLIVRYHLKNGDYSKLLSTCQRLGTNQSNLWLQAMTGLRNDKKAPPNLLSQVLQVIANKKLQSPLQVLNCVAVENGPNLGSVRDYFTQIFHKESDSIKKEEDLVEKCRKNSTTLRNHIINLRDDPIEFRGTVCDTCHQSLTQPALFFLCQHSFHQDCVREYSENDRDCPVCHIKNKQLQDALHAQSEARGQHEIFHNLLHRAPEPFSVVAEYFGRALFNKVMIFNEENENNFTGNIVDDDKKSKPKQTHPSVSQPRNKMDEFGKGAEARLRLNEIQSKVMKDPVSEARMRIEENPISIYSTSSEKNPPFNRSKIAREAIPQTSQTRTNSIAKNIANPSVSSTNPFEDPDSYDEKMNPFANESDVNDDGLIKKQKPYDNNLNPFA